MELVLKLVELAPILLLHSNDAWNVSAIADQLGQQMNKEINRNETSILIYLVLQKMLMQNSS